MNGSRPNSASYQDTHEATHSLSEKLKAVNFDTPAKIFQNKHAIHQFESVTPDVSVPGTPIVHRLPKRYSTAKSTSSTSEATSAYASPSLAPSIAYTPSSMSPHESGDDEIESATHGNSPFSISRPESPDINPQPLHDTNHHVLPHTSSSATIGTSSPARPSTPSQFVFKRPEYDKKYHHTHFHHLEKKDTILHELKRFFKHDKKKHHKKPVASSSSATSTRPSLSSKISDLSFANEFNKDLEGRYGKWGK
jgi:hypothetical protein